MGRRGLSAKRFELHLGTLPSEVAPKCWRPPTGSIPHAAPHRVILPLSFAVPASQVPLLMMPPSCGLQPEVPAP